MRSIFNKSLLLASTMISFGASAPAFAQGAETQADVVVTARRIQETAQDVPISMTIFNQEQLENRGISSAIELAQNTPGLSSNPRFGNDTTNFQIRGAVQESRTTASVATYFADAVSLRGGPAAAIQTGGDGIGPGQLYDLQNVQVLKGPQGTLFGRNTTGGAVLVVPKLPSDTFEGYVEGKVGDFDMRGAQAVVNIPVTENFKLRAGFDAMEREGYLKNISGVGPKDFNDVNYYAGRLSALVNITPTIDNYTVISFSNSDNNGTASKLVDRYPGDPNRGNLAAQLAPAYAALAGTDPYTVYSLVPAPESKLNTWQVINKTSWQLNDNLELQNIISYGELEADLMQDPYGATWPVATVNGPSFGEFATAYKVPGGHMAAQNTFTEELRLSGSSFASALDWQAGVYYETSDPTGTSGTASPANAVACVDISRLLCQDTSALGAARISPAGTQWQYADVSIKNMGVYAQGTYHFNDQWSATAGLRYTKDESTLSSQLGILFFSDSSTNLLLGRPSTYAGATNQPELYCLSAGPNLPGSSNPIARGAAAVLPILQGRGFCQTNAKQESEAPTGVIGLDFNPTEALHFFGKYSRGYRQGSVNPYGALGFQTFEPEEMDVYELGLKSNWKGELPGHFNITAFMNETKDAQVTSAAIDLTGAISPNSFVTSGESEQKGFEIEAGLKVLKRLNLGLSYAYIDSELTGLTLPGTPATTGTCAVLGGNIPTGASPFNCLSPVSVVGRPNVLTPEQQYTLSVNYDLPLDPKIGNINIGATFSHIDDQYLTFSSFTTQSIATGGAPGLQPARDLVGFNATWNGVFGSPVDLGIVGTNIFDEEYIQVSNERVSSGFNSYTYGAPAMWAFRARYNFGG